MLFIFVYLLAMRKPMEAVLGNCTAKYSKNKTQKPDLNNYPKQLSGLTLSLPCKDSYHGTNPFPMPGWRKNPIAILYCSFQITPFQQNASHDYHETRGIQSSKIHPL